MDHKIIHQDDASPFHRGEQDVQERLGVRDIEQWARKVVRNYLPDQHREFHTLQPFLVVSAKDEAGRPWATLLEGPDGFVTSPDAQQLVINAKPNDHDALAKAFVDGADIGILGIELATRRRNRVNGRVVGNSKSAITFAVDQAFGNCPQYIREREWRRIDDAPTPSATTGSILTAKQRQWIENADTFFIASGYRGDEKSPTFGMDVSHRGGDLGFVEILSGSSIRFPDYAGNNHYNTIGNLVLDPKAGFLFVDFKTGSLLQLTGKVTIDWDSDKIANFAGARRLISFEIESIVELTSALSLRWQTDAESVRSLRLVEKIPESADTTSFIFEARDGGPLAAFEPGQYLPIELDIPTASKSVQRTYSLSSSPNDERYRITVKRDQEGLVSKYLHDNVETGAIISSQRPAGDFMMTCNVCPLVLVSAGVGVTPMMSILHAVASENNDRPVWFVHGARDSDHHSFAKEARDLANNKPNIHIHVAYSRPHDEDEIGVHYNSEGRVTGDMLNELVGNADAHYFLCGPTTFIAQIQADLEQGHVPAAQIHFETFGPVG